MINRVVLVGRLTKDPELKYTQSGIANVRFTLAVNRTFSNQNGEREADFITCVAWRKQAENLAKFMTKGSLVGIDGRIQTSNFEGRDGQRIYMTDVVAESIQFLETKNSRNNNQQQGGYNQQQNYGQQNYNQPQQDSNNPFESQSSTNEAPPIDVTNDDLPF